MAAVILPPLIILNPSSKFLNFSVEKQLVKIITQIFVVYYLLCITNKQTSPIDKRFIKFIVNIMLSFFSKVNHHITAYNKMASCWIWVLKKVTLLKLHTILNLIADFIESVSHLFKMLIQ